MSNHDLMSAEDLFAACQRVAHHFDWKWSGCSPDPKGTAMFHIGYQPFVIPLELVLEFDHLMQQPNKDWNRPREAPVWLRRHSALEDVL